MKKSKESSQKKPLSLKSLILSGLAAMFGVQSEKNRQRDFEKGKPSDFIFMGIGLMLFFLLGVYFIVQLVLSTSGVD